MHDKNLPVPAHTRAPAGHRWLWWIGPPAVITAAYRLIPARTRRRWNPAGNATSHTALAAILAGGGWRAFWTHALPVSLGSIIALEHQLAEPNMWWLPQPGGSLIRPVPPESRW
jgi:hypothetical protein